MATEIERKYLIRRPDEALLREQLNCAIWEIEQIYLTERTPGETRRIRRVVEAGETRYYKTFKRRMTDLSCQEDEGQIDCTTYEALRTEADSARKPILKTRYRIPYCGQVLEFDLYPFWTDRAILEIELENEDTPSYIPEWVEVIRDVTADYRYKNKQLAKCVPVEVW